MIPAGERPFNGVYASTLCPLLPDFRLDEDGLARHVIAVTEGTGLVGVLCNGHAGENFLLSREHKRRVVEIARDAIGERSIIVSGVNAESTLEAVEHARDAEQAGADAIMIFAPNSWAFAKTPATVLRHHRMVVESVSVPIVLFQGSVNAGETPFAPAVLEQLVQLPRVVAVKEGSWEVAAYEANRRLIHSVAPHVAVMGSGDEHLLASFMVGSEGAMVSLAVLIPEVIAELYACAQREDWTRARSLHDVVYPLARAIYGKPPGQHATVRLKTCLKRLGRLRHDTVMPPLGPLGDDEVVTLQQALDEAGL
ncbi:MAG: dihydrodipicolinate synthase family protein [Gammaproteobacteria bacterium]